MKLFLQTVTCFVFVTAVLGQGYRGRQRKPKAIPKKQPFQAGGFNPINDPFDFNNMRGQMGGFDPMFDQFGRNSMGRQSGAFGQFSDSFGNGLNSLRGGGISEMPEDIKRILGSTLTGEDMIGGMGGLPRHGGTLNADGMVNGWGANSNIPVIPAVQMWNDPLNGAAFPVDYRGEELVFDQRLNRYVKKPVAPFGHQIAKEAHVGAKTGGIIAGGVPTGHNTVKAEHNIVKQTNHIERKPIGGAIGGIGSPIGVDPMSHNIDKQMLSGAAGAGVGLIGSATVDHLGTVNVGDIAVDEPRVLAHNIGVATLGADAVAAHNIAESSGFPVIRGFINRNGPIASGIGHNVAKTSDVVGASPFGVGVDPFGQVAHDNMKISSGRHIGVSNLGPIDAGFGVNQPIGMHPVGVKGKTADPVHNVNKVGQTGIAGIGHGPIASSLGHGLAKQAIGGAANLVNRGSRGGLAAQDPIAIAVAKDLARDSLNVADRTIALASSGLTGHSGIGAGMGIVGQNAMIHPKPVKKLPPKFPTGYAGRRRH